MNIGTYFDYNDHIAFISTHTKIGTPNKPSPNVTKLLTNPMLCLVCIPCIKGHAGDMPIHCHLLMLYTHAYTVGGTPDSAAGSTSSSAGATVPPVHSSAQLSTPLTSYLQPSMHHQAPPSHQGQQPQMPITSQFQQPMGKLSNVKSTIPL